MKKNNIKDLTYKVKQRTSHKNVLIFHYLLYKNAFGVEHEVEQRDKRQKIQDAIFTIVQKSPGRLSNN